MITTTKIVQAKARVQVTVEVEASLWGEDCTIGEIYRAAGQEGVSRVTNALAKAELKCRIVGEPNVIGVITETSK